MRRVTWLVALAAMVALVLPSSGRAAVMQVAQPVPDFNNDGFGDLAVGAPGENVGSLIDAGAVSVLYGRANGMRSDRRTITQDTARVPGAAEAGDQFGGALVAGRFNKDAYWDVAVGAPGEDVGRAGAAGAVIILFGSRAGLGGGPVGRLLTQGRAEAGDLFGFSLAVGEISGPAGAELAVGAPGETVRGARKAGAVTVFSRPGIAPTRTDLYQGIPRKPGKPGVPGVPEAGDRYGWAIAANDFTPASGRDSLAVGAPGEDV
ncbi:MAG TPA: integrin alpha, partial [Micromonosporaceae bacterium]|nr:integrin alpha [Micromonosporaceae bacterium]